MKPTITDMNSQSHKRLCESYEARYSKQFDSIAKNPSFKGSLRPNDIYVLGQQFDTYKKYESYVSESSSASSLGPLPRIAIDLITATYGLSIAPQLCSEQTLDDVQGWIYYKKVYTKGYPLTAQEGLEKLPEDRWMSADGKYDGAATTLEGAWKKFLDTRPRPPENGEGALTPATLAAKNFDATTFSAFKGWQANPAAYMSERQAIVGEGSVTIKYAIGNLRWNVPIQCRLVNTNGDVKDSVGMCTGPGQLPTFYGEVTPTASQSGGDMVLTIPQGYRAFILYTVDFEKAPDVPAIDNAFDVKPVEAQIFGVKEELGDFKAFALSKRFGTAAADSQMQDLVGHMAMAESVKVINAYSASADKYTPITWDLNRPNGVSEYEHRQSIKYAFDAASRAIYTRAGKGRVNKVIAGPVACEYISSHSSFQAAPKTDLIGPSVFGTLENGSIQVIRSSVGVAPNEIICAYCSENDPFNAPVVCATYMPVFLTDTLQVANNPFQKQRAIATWKAIDAVVPEYVQRIVITKNAGAPADANIYITSTPAVGSGSGNGGNVLGNG